MIIRRNLLALSIVTALSFYGVAQAETAPEAASNTETAADPRDTQELEEVVVKGIRQSLQKSLDTKRDAESHVDVVTAVDIGKMPDKNVADSLQRVVGVTISSASANEGGFDENDRVSMRGTNPSLTQTLINGHPVSSGDWFVLNQTGSVGRSVSYSLLPSQLVGSVVVHKTAQAADVEGGVAGYVNIKTRSPLDFAEPLTIEGAVGGVHATLPDKNSPQFSGLLNWKNSGGTMGLMVQAFSEKRHLRRDGQELLGLRADCSRQRRCRGESRPRERVVSDPHRFGAVRAGARAPRWPGRSGNPRRRPGRPEFQRVHLEDGREQLQPQLHVLADPRAQSRRRPGAGRGLCGAQQHAGRR